MYQVITTIPGRQYADLQREAQRFEDPYAEILWLIDGYVFYIAEPTLDAAYFAYARQFDLWSVECGIDGVEPRDYDTFAKVVSDGFVTWVLTYPDVERN